MNDIKTRGWLHASDQRIFPDSKQRSYEHEHIMDIPGTFFDIDSRELHLINLSFREISWGFSAYQVIADVYMHDTLLGRNQILSSIDLPYNASADKLASLLRNCSTAIFYKAKKVQDDEISHIAKIVEDKVGSALFSWAKQSKDYNDNRVGIPKDVYIEFDNQNPIHKVGFLMSAYFQDKVFATPYVYIALPNIRERIIGAYHSLKGEPRGYQPFKTEPYIKTSLSNHKVIALERQLLNDNLALLPSELQRFEDAGDAFEEIRKYLLKKPTVARDGE